MSNTTDGRDDADDLKQALQSLHPRTSIDRQELLVRVQREAQSQPTPANSGPERNVRSRSANWWPALTALSWLVTAGVWWNATRPVSTGNPESVGVMSAANTNEGASAIVVGISQFDQLGQTLDTINPRVDESPVRFAAPTDVAPPVWLVLLGINVEQFTPTSPEERWERMQEQADVPRRLTSINSGETPSATYASLREEFDTPIRRNWQER